MRFYANFPEALNELKRELKEMGIQVHTKSVQNKDISDKPEFSTLEIQNYQYLVTSPDFRQIPLNNQAWAEAEFAERVSNSGANPGNAWKLREEYWGQFLNEYKKFDYAYPERMLFGLSALIELLQRDNMTRRAFLPIFDASQDDVANLNRRIPCSLGYWFYYRQGKLNMTYLQRSSDFSEHFNNDIYLADRLKDYVAKECGMEPGTFSHWLGSLHIFAKDVAGVF